MDNRLDFMNLLRDYTETLSEENDSLLVLGHYKKDGYYVIFK
jgi:hypothetical protein